MSGAAPASAPPAAGWAALAVALVGVLAFAGFLLSLAGAPDGGGDTRGANALSRSAVGYAGLVRLLGETGRDVRISRNAPLAEGLLILTPPPFVDFTKVRRSPGRGAVLVVAPKWAVRPDPRRRGHVDKVTRYAEAVSVLKAGRAPPGGAMASVSAPGVTRPALRTPADAITAGRFAADFSAPVAVGPVDRFTTFAGGSAAPMLADAAGRPVLVKLPGEPVYLLSDPDLLNDQGLASLDTARAAVALIDALRDGGPVSFDVALNGFGRERNALGLMVRPPFAAATACLVLAALLAGLHGLARFGPPARAAPAYADGKRALVDSAASLLAVARREPRLAGAYAELVRAETARALGLRGADGAHAADFDRVVARRGAAPWATLGDAARSVRTPAALMAYTKRLQDWRAEVTGGR